MSSDEATIWVCRSDIADSSAATRASMAFIAWASVEAADGEPAVANGGEAGFFATVLQSFFAPSATIGALPITSDHGISFSAASQLIAMQKLSNSVF